MELRKEIDELIAGNGWNAAYRRLCELWRQDRGLGSAAFVVSRYDRLRPYVSLTPYRLAILRSFTLEPAVNPLRAAALTSGIDLQVQLGEFNAYPQEILDRDSFLYRLSPDAVILAVQSRDIAPDLWSGYADLSQDAAAAAIERTVGSYRRWLRQFREGSPASLLLHNLEQPLLPALGVLDAQSVSGQREAFDRINHQLRTLAGEHRGVYLLDYDSLLARHGRARWHDQRKWLTARMPISAEHIVHLAAEWLRYIVPLAGRTAKVVVVDLDNTLWGGVVGEDGITGISLGTEYPGANYQELQRALLDLHRKGILLAICSKNNPDDAMEVLAHHPGMLLRPEHFSCMRINWNDKAQNLREIAAELNIGLDALAFLDDNPAERENIRAVLPEANVIELPCDPENYAAAVRDCAFFQRLTLSEEDRQRTSLYATEHDRSRAREQFVTKDDFLRFLEQEAEISPVLPTTLTRVAQLTQKTNQFNLTTRRYTEQQISQLASNSHSVYSIHVRDRYGDQGLVGVAITRDQGEDCEIDTFLLSCRVIGRKIESALLAHVAGQARDRGCRRLLGRFIPTKKNLPAREFYSQHAFKLVSETEEGNLWVLDLEKDKVAHPDCVRLSTSKGEPN